MRKRGLIKLFYTIIAATLLFSCAKGFRKLEKSDDWKIKYQGALHFYENEDYARASILFEQILPIIRGLPEGEDVQFKLSYCNFYQGSYLLSSHYFKTFYETYGRSEKAQEAQYMYAYSLYADSPEYNLDQTSSYEAIDAIQAFLNKYPDSEFREEASEIINEMQKKLETKAYEKTKQYLKLRIYKSAIVAFENFRNDYPDSKYNEEIFFLKIEAQYELAEQSLYFKQKERYEKVKEYYEYFIDNYPNSSYLKNAEKYYGNSIDILSKFATDNIN
ncbi:MAG: outer membrane protein assembly factor BamD [Cyclobacteriaceae bacterium]|nr:outer membrane protein assembly factor BamD [Cyclobacteriaceae bacterium]